jgi:hypothetical protein
MLGIRLFLGSQDIFLVFLSEIMLKFEFGGSNKLGSIARACLSKSRPTSIAF